PNGRVLVRGDQPHGPAPALGEKDRAAVQPERLPELAGDGLEDVDEVERRGDFLEDLDDGEQMLALALELGNARLESGEESHGVVCVPGGGGVKLPRARARDSFGAHANAHPRCLRRRAHARRARPREPRAAARRLDAGAGVAGHGPASTAARLTGIARVLPTDSLDPLLSALLARVRGPLYVPLDQATRDEPRLRDLVFVGRDVRNLRPVVDSLRLVKDADEIARMRKAIDISG